MAAREGGAIRMSAYEIRVRGQVQGVGFRPFIWGLARARGLCGDVCNDTEGVLIRVLIAPEALDAFCLAIRTEAPPLALVQAVEARAIARFAAQSFEIRASSGTALTQTRVTPDAATCPACLAETMTPDTRRSHYPFTNCTHCGPRFSILHALPYDRAQTTMARFDLCPECRAEYTDPSDRRFHAQPIACPTCGPQIWLEEGESRFERAEALTRAVALLQQGQIVAIKGLGGFHLCLDARNEAAIVLLRHRKHRPSKPLAVMAPRAQLREIVDLTPEMEAALAQPAAPILLAPSRGVLPQSLAPGLKELGVMLPYTPLHHLLLAQVGGPLVMTSANASGAPQIIDNATARAELPRFAEAILLHDRDIARRLDDSVLRGGQVLRRARGLAPQVTPVGGAGADVLALGGQMKGAICLLKGAEALVSHHLGDLDHPLCYDEFRKAIADYTALFDHRAAAIAVDLHEGYRATQTGQEMARALGLPLIGVQHHHAHLAACLAETGWAGGPVAGIILDGTGAGPDGTLWGGEILLGDYAGYERVAHLAQAPLAGGDLAARQPWRNALMRLDQAGLGAEADRLFAAYPLAQVRAAVRAGVNAPLSSSAGRLFDAAAALLGLCFVQSYEGEAAMLLEAAADRPCELPITASLSDPAPLFALLCDASRSVGARAYLFHLWLARAVAGPARALVETGRAGAVALSGGVAQNRLLSELIAHELSGLPLLMHQTIPAGDGGLALGQAMVARAQLALGLVERA